MDKSALKSDRPIRPGGCSWRKITGPLRARHLAMRRSNVRRTRGDLRMSTAELLEDANGADAGCGFQHRDDLGLNSGKRVGTATPAGLRLLGCAIALRGQGNRRQPGKKAPRRIAEGLNCQEQNTMSWCGDGTYGQPTEVGIDVDQARSASHRERARSPKVIAPSRCMGGRSPLSGQSCHRQRQAGRSEGPPLTHLRHSPRNLL